MIREKDRCHVELNQRKITESKMAETKMRAENAEMALAQGGRKLVERLENKIKDLEEELEAEKRHSRDATKFSRQMERNYKDMEYQCQEEKRNYERLEVNQCLFSLIISNPGVSGHGRDAPRQDWDVQEAG